MAAVEIRWRPSGGRGEYEHVPSSILLGRRVLVRPISVENSLIRTDVTGRMRDGKPRIRREDPNDRSLLNVPSLVAALALLPDPIREDQGQLRLPLRDKGYVISSIAFDVTQMRDGEAECQPTYLQVLHDSSTIDLATRLTRVRALLTSDSLSPNAKAYAERYTAIVKSGVPSSDLRDVADALIKWLRENPRIEDQLNEIVPAIAAEPPASQSESVILDELTADETKRRLVSHFALERDDEIRKSKIKQHKSKFGNINCENCGFSFEEKYGARGAGYIEVHHILPLASLLPNTLTRISDLMLLCANCHRMVHRKRLALTPDELLSTTANVRSN